MSAQLRFDPLPTCLSATSIIWFDRFYSAPRQVWGLAFMLNSIPRMLGLQLLICMFLFLLGLMQDFLVWKCICDVTPLVYSYALMPLNQEHIYLSCQIVSHLVVHLLKYYSIYLKNKINLVLFCCCWQLQQQSTPEDVELAQVLRQLKEKFEVVSKVVESFQSKNSNNIFNTGINIIDI